MDVKYIIIRTGYENIIHNIEFQPKTIPNGKALVDAQHVLNVEEHRKNGCSFLIKAQVIRQTSVTLTPYSTQLNIDNNRRVTGASYTCVYNQSKKCKHISALIYYINNEASLSKLILSNSGESQLFDSLSSKNIQRDNIFVKCFLQVSPSLHTLHDESVFKLIQSSALKTVLLEAKRDENDRAAKAVMDNILADVTVSLQQEECASYLTTFFNLSTLKALYIQNYVISEDLINFYKNKIVLSREEIIQLCCDTLQQSKCPKWLETRNLRISASKNAHEIKSRVTKPVEKLVSEILFPKKIDTPALRYGRKTESIAAKAYETCYSMSIKKVGLLVSEKQPWLCTSLDGICLKNNNIIRIIEIKCPITCNKVPIVDFNTNTCNVSYLKFQDSNVILKESSIYFTQYQIQLYITGLDICDLFVYSPVKNGSIFISVYRNENFLAKVISKCEEFYFKYYFPKLYEKNNAAKKSKLRCFTGENVNNHMS